MYWTTLGENLQNLDCPFRSCSLYNNVNYGAWYDYKPLFGSSLAICRLACSEISPQSTKKSYREVREMVGHSTIWQIAWQLKLSCFMFYTLIEHTVSTNNSARYIRALSQVQFMQFMHNDIGGDAREVLCYYNGSFGSPFLPPYKWKDKFCIARERIWKFRVCNEHLTKKSLMYLTRLNEISGGCETVVTVLA